MKRRSLLLVLMLVLVVSAFVSACGNNSTKTTEPPKTETKTEPKTETKKDDPPKEAAKEQVFRFNLGTEPPTLDPGQSQDVTSFTVLSATFEGLTRVNEKDEVLPGMAEKWSISDDGKTYTFNIRKDAKWSNGDPVTAHDFVYAWQRVLDPATEPAPPYNYQLFYLVNGEEFNTKKITDANQVGVKATDDYTLVVNLVNPTPYFLNLLSFQTYYPVHKSVKDNPKTWASEANTIISNGPFKVSNWVHQSSLELVPNEHYYAKDEIKFTKVSMTMVEDSMSQLNMYETNALDYVGRPTGTIPADQIPVLKQTKKDELIIQPEAGLYYYLFNNKVKPFDNVKIRKALAMAIDRKAIVENVTLAGQVPAYYMVPLGINGVKGQYRDEVPVNYFKENVEEAKKLLAEGLAESNLTSMPEFTLTYNTNDNHKKIALAIVDMWKQNLGINVQIQNQEWAVFLKDRTALNYQVARAGWSPDYNDAMTFMDLYTTGSGNNDLGYSNPKFDELIIQAKKEADPVKRREIIAQAEQIIIGDDMALMPIYNNSMVGMMKPNVKNVFFDYQGMLHFTRGYLE